MFRFEEILNVELCKNNPNSIIVFGDNLIGKGKKGKEIILPINKIGSGLADLQNKSPKIYKMIESFYKAVETKINKGEKYNESCYKK